MRRKTQGMYHIFMYEKNRSCNIFDTFVDDYFWELLKDNYIK